MAEHIQGSVVLRRTVWPAVFAGVVIVLVAQLSLSLLGLGIGAATFDPLAERHPAEGLGLGSAIWLGLTALVSLFAGGWVAGRLASNEERVDGMLHGVLTWGLASLVSVFLLSTAIGRVVSGGASILGGALNLAGRGAAAVAPQVAAEVSATVGQSDVDLGDIKNEARKLLTQTRRPELQPKNLERRAENLGRAAAGSAETAAKDPQTADTELEKLIDRVFAQGRTVVNAVDRDAIVNVLVARTDMNREEAGKTVDRWQATAQSAKAALARTAQEAEQKTREVADAAARGLSKAAIWTFVGLLLGFIAGSAGGFLGSPGRRIVPGVTRFEREAA